MNRRIKSEHFDELIARLDELDFTALNEANTTRAKNCHKKMRSLIAIAKRKLQQESRPASQVRYSLLEAVQAGEALFLVGWLAFAVRLSSQRTRVRKKRRRRALTQSKILVECASVLLPRKISDEQLGDLVEQLTDLEESGATAWRVQVQAVVAVGWAFVYLVRDFVKPAALLSALWKWLGG